MNKCFNLRRVIHNDNPSQTVEKGHRKATFFYSLYCVELLGGNFLTAVANNQQRTRINTGALSNSGSYYLATSDFCTGISRRLRGEVVFTAVNDNNLAYDFAYREAVCEYGHIRKSVVPEKRR